MNEEKISLEVLKSAIKEKGAKWEPTITSMSQISSEQRKMRLGLQPSSVELQVIAKLGLERSDNSKNSGEGLESASNPGSVGLPSKYDWRDVNGVNWTTPIKDQGGCGSCVAFGTLASLEALLRIKTYKDPNKSVDLSEAHLFYCNNRDCNLGDPNYGWHMDPACEYLKKNGVPDEACYPYTDNNQPCNTCSNWQSRIDQTKIISWSNTKDVNQMKTNIVNNGPQITGMAVFRDFWDYGGGVYEPVTDVFDGYHCVSVVGFDDEEQCWICKNSWGTDWGEANGGERGWFRIKYGECDIQDVFGMWNMVVPPKKEPDCIIATAAFGSRLDPHVQFLRGFRDEIVLKSMFKTPFERLLDQYYTFSPPIARKMEENSLLRKCMKYSIVYPFVLCAKGVARLLSVIRKIKM